MTTDYSKPYRNVRYFGLWADEVADRQGRRDALAVLQEAVGRCEEENVYTDELEQALDYLSMSATRPGPFQDFRMALRCEDPQQRVRQVERAYERIRHLYDKECQQGRL